jgi:hypothetical protein
MAKSTGRLDLTDMRLGSVPPEVFDIEDLEDLVLVGNALRELPGVGRGVGTGAGSQRIAANPKHPTPEPY